MDIVLCFVLGYLLGMLSPAALLSKIKNINLRENGSGNLGATNTFLVIGKWYGVLVMLIDIAKAFLAVKLAQTLLPELGYAGMLAGLGAITGHIFPFYMKFKGGKGLAAFSGVVLATNLRVFCLLAVIGAVLALITNRGVALPVSAAVMFSPLLWLETGSVCCFLIALAASLLVIAVHMGNVKKALNGDYIKVREYIRTNIFSKG